MESLTTTNIWLGILAAVSLLELLIVAGIAVFAFRLYNKATLTLKALEALEREHVAPLRARIDGVLDDVQRVMDGAKHAQEVLKHVTGTGAAVAGAVRAKTWPIVGLVQGLKTAAAVVMRNGRKASHDSSYGSM